MGTVSTKMRDLPSKEQTFTRVRLYTYCAKGSFWGHGWYA